MAVCHQMRSGGAIIVLMEHFAREARTADGVDWTEAIIVRIMHKTGLFCFPLPIYWMIESPEWKLFPVILIYWTNRKLVRSNTDLKTSPSRLGFTPYKSQYREGEVGMS